MNASRTIMTSIWPLVAPTVMRNPNFTCPVCHRIGHDAVEADRGQSDSKRAVKAG